MKNRRRRDNCNQETTRVEDAHTCDQYSEIQAAIDVNFLKSTKVNNENIQIVEGKLRLTAAYRKKMLNDLSIDLLETFPYFFTNPELVRTRHFYFSFPCVVICYVLQYYLILVISCIRSYSTLKEQTNLLVISCLKIGRNMPVK